MLVLGIESSCDDLSMALLQDGKLLAQATASQTLDHLPFGGVVPEIASRRHLDFLEATLKKTLLDAGKALSDVEGIAATYAPGLVGSLLVGLNFAKALAYSLAIPFRGIHHIEAHLLSPLLEHEESFPALGLVVSGGHSHLYRIEEFGKYELIGHTVDDAAGEAFDKVAKMMGLPFPGGPEIEKLAQKGNPLAFTFAKPQVKAHPSCTSFSGMKTAALDYWKKAEAKEGEELEKIRADLAASFQKAAVEALHNMVERALQKNQVNQMGLAGGVACNKLLRQSLQELAAEYKIPLIFPSPKFCTDNGAMVAYVGERYLQAGKTSDWSLNAQARASLTL